MPHIAIVIKTDPELTRVHRYGDTFDPVAGIRLRGYTGSGNMRLEAITPEGFTRATIDLGHEYLDQLAVEWCKVRGLELPLRKLEET